MTIPPTSETTEVIDGVDKIMDKVMYALSNVKECIDGYYDSTELCSIVTRSCSIVTRSIEKGVDPEFQTLENQEENMKSYLNEVLSEITKIRDSNRLPR